jgi:hypothetical protein
MCRSSTHPSGCEDGEYVAIVECLMASFASGRMQCHGDFIGPAVCFYLLDKLVSSHKHYRTKTSECQDGFAFCGLVFMWLSG